MVCSIGILIQVVHQTGICHIEMILHCRVKKFIPCGPKVCQVGNVGNSSSTNGPGCRENEEINVTIQSTQPEAKEDSVQIVSPITRNKFDSKSHLLSQYIHGSNRNTKDSTKFSTILSQNGSLM